MKTKFLITAVSIAVFGMSNVQAQEKDGHNHDHSKMEMSKKEYACPMHADVKSDKPGECPKCGMALVEQKMKMDMSEKAAASFTCPMHAEVVSDKPGECPKCGMTLVEKKSDKKKKSTKKEKAKKEDHSGHSH